MYLAKSANGDLGEWKLRGKSFQSSNQQCHSQVRQQKLKLTEISGLGDDKTSCNFLLHSSFLKGYQSPQDCILFFKTQYTHSSYHYSLSLGIFWGGIFPLIFRTKEMWIHSFLCIVISDPKHPGRINWYRCELCSHVSCLQILILSSVAR